MTPSNFQSFQDTFQASLPQFSSLEASLWIALLGLLIGSFLNVVISRLPIIMEQRWYEEACDFLGVKPDPKHLPNLTLSSPRSRCPQCDNLIRWYDNIPVLSWLMLKGRCRNCRMPIPAIYPSVELLTAILSGLWVYFSWPHPMALLFLPFIWMGVAATFIDLKHKLLPDLITLSLLWIGLGVSLSGLGHLSPQASLLGAIAGYLVLFIPAWIFLKIRGIEGMGMGDAKYLAAIGAWSGALALIHILLTASIMAIIAHIVARLIAVKNRSGKSNYGSDEPIALPFGPWLFIAGIIVIGYNQLVG